MTLQTCREAFKDKRAHVSEPASLVGLRSRISDPEVEWSGKLSLETMKLHQKAGGVSSQCADLCPGVSCWSSILQPLVPLGLQGFQCALWPVSITRSLCPLLSFIHPYGSSSTQIFLFSPWFGGRFSLSLCLLRRINLKRNKTSRRSAQSEITHLKRFLKCRIGGRLGGTYVKRGKTRGRRHKREEKRLQLGLGKTKRSVLIQDWRNPQSGPEQPFRTPILTTAGIHVCNLAAYFLNKI